MRLDYVHAGKLDPIVIAYKDGTKYLFSYERPVAAYIPDRGYVAVEASATSHTNKGRIEQWLTRQNAVAEAITYEELVNLFSAHLMSLDDRRD